MNKTKKIAYFVVILAIITAIIVVSSTIFSISKLQLVWYNNADSNLLQVNSEDILTKSSAKNCSVFLLNREDTITKIQKEYPLIRVINLEISFPNILKLHVVQRENVYAVKIKNQKYAIVDEYLNVLDVVSDYENNNLNAIYINSDEVCDQNFKQGDYIDLFGDSIYLNMYNSFSALSRDVIDMRAIIKSVDIDADNMLINTFFGTVISIEKPFGNTMQKINMAISALDLLDSSNYANSKINIFIEKDILKASISSLN